LDNVHFEKRSVLRTGFPDAGFDFIYCTGVLHHTADPFGGLAELCRVLRPGGKILISLYNSLGFLPREARRRVARWLGGEDIDQRVLWGRRCFPFISRRLIKGNRNDAQSALYDYFAIPHESLHSIGEVLAWFDRLGLEYIGSFPPARLDDYPAMFAAEAYKSVEPEFQSRVRFTLARVGSAKVLRRRRPGILSQALVQTMWLLFGVGIFSVGALKPPDRFPKVQPCAPVRARDLSGAPTSA
jgi:SAM-dependent methyltransferase